MTELILWYTGSLADWAGGIAIAHVPLSNLYFIVKGYKLTPFFKKNYPEPYEKYSDIRFELTSAGFADILSKNGVEMDDISKAEAREIRITQITYIVLTVFWMLIPRKI